MRIMGNLDPNQLVPSRDELESETEALDRSIVQLARDVFDSDVNVSRGVLASWDSFVSEFHAWNSGPSFLAHVVNETWLSELVDFQRRFNHFVDVFGSAGVGSGVPAFNFVSKPGPIDNLVNGAGNALKKGLSTIETTLIVSGVVVVGLYLFTIYEAGRTVRAAGMRVF